jgi:hypothetical protein
MGDKKSWVPIGQYRNYPLPIKPAPPPCKYKILAIDRSIAFQRATADLEKLKRKIDERLSKSIKLHRNYE